VVVLGANLHKKAGLVCSVGLRVTGSIRVNVNQVLTN
jgi:hypothetical protein